MSKEKLLNKLHHLQNALVMGLAADVCFADPRVNRLIEGVRVQIAKDLVVDLTDVAAALCDEAARTELRFEFRKQFFRGFAAEPFELVEKYAAMTKQTSRFTGEPWYPFAKLVRNTLRHGTIEFNTFLRGQLPIQWRGRTVTASEEGHELDAVFAYEDAVRLLEDIRDFATRIN